MNAHPRPVRHMPPPPETLKEISDLGREIASARYCPECDRLLTRAAADLARFATQVYELYAALLNARMRSANLEAAIRAALAAQSEGELNPLAYLRYELPDTAEGDAHGA